MTISTTIQIERHGSPIQTIICAACRRLPSRLIEVGTLDTTKILREEEIPWATRALTEAYIVEEARR